MENMFESSSRQIVYDVKVVQSCVPWLFYVPFHEVNVSYVMQDIPVNVMLYYCSSKNDYLV